MKPVDLREAIERLLREGKSIADIAHELNCARRSVYYYRSKLITQGDVE